MLKFKFLNVFTDDLIMIDLSSKHKVDLHLTDNLESHPQCVHGPTLLFSRYCKIQLFLNT